MKMSVLVIVFFVFCSTGCNTKSNSTDATKEEYKQPVKVKIDLSTPDNALKSYWQTNDNKRLLFYKDNIKLSKDQNEISIDIINKFLTGSIKQSLLKHRASDIRNVLTEYTRDIIEVKNETETRAVVFVMIKNVTKIPTNLSLSENDNKIREEGKLIKYVVEKEPSGWKISQVYEKDIFQEKFSKKEVWQPLYDLTDLISHRYVNVFTSEN